MAYSIGQSAQTVSVYVSVYRALRNVHHTNTRKLRSTLSSRGRRRHVAVPEVEVCVIKESGVNL